jgi:uncharacterized protein YjbJ (UPF0337 family)
MKSGIRDQAEGKAKEIKGAAKQEWAKQTGDVGRKAEGALEETTGKFQQKTGQIKRDITRD